jgi:hypothetical protein
MNKKDLIKKVNYLTNSQNGGGTSDQTDLHRNALSRIPTHMLQSQIGQPGVSIANIAALERQQAQNFNAQQRQPMIQAEHGIPLQQARNLWQLHAQQQQSPVRTNNAPQAGQGLLLQAQQLWQRHLHELGQPLLRTINAQQAGPALPKPRNAAQNRITCPSNGWAQRKNDCWIDSAYYAMFVPSNLQNWFFTFFNNIGKYQIESLKKFSVSSFEYLIGIDNGDDEGFLSRKQIIKKDILLSIKEVCRQISPGLYDTLSARSTARSLINTSGSMNREGNGDASFFFKFISIIQPELLFFETPVWQTVISKINRNNRTNVIQKYIKNILTIPINMDVDIVVIDASYYTPRSTEAMTNEIRLCRADNTVLREILSIGNFSLEAVIRGNINHYTVDFKCSDNQWYNYNNQGGPGHSRITNIRVESRNWLGNDGLIFIFRRRT